MALGHHTSAAILLALVAVFYVAPSASAQVSNGPSASPPAAAVRGSATTPADRPYAPTSARRFPPVSGQPGAGADVAGANRPETLEEAWRVALAVNQGLEAERWGVSSAHHRLQAARAMRWPDVNVEGSYAVRDNEPAFRFDFPGIALPTDRFPYSQDESFAFRTNVDLPLYTSGRIRHGIAAADARLSSEQLGLEQSAMDLKLRVAADYVAVLRAQREVELAETAVRSLESHLRDVTLLFEHEQVPANDLLAAQVSLADARQGAIQAHNQLDGARAGYNRRLGRALDAPVHVAERAPRRVPEDLPTLTGRALQRRPALSERKAQARALDHRARSVMAETRPQVELRGEYAFEENRYRSPEGITAVGVGVSWNALDFGRSRHEAASLSDGAERARRLVAELESAIALEVRRAWLRVEETRRRLQVTAEAIQQAEENLRVARERYNLGMGISTEVLDAEKLRTRAYRNHDNATYDAVLAELRLRHATGEL